jgi:hypothetical protein
MRVEAKLEARQGGDGAFAWAMPWAPSPQPCPRGWRPAVTPPGGVGRPAPNEKCSKPASCSLKEGIDAEDESTGNQGSAGDAADLGWDDGAFEANGTRRVPATGAATSPNRGNRAAYLASSASRKLGRVDCVDFRLDEAASPRDGGSGLGGLWRL